MGTIDGLKPGDFCVFQHTCKRGCHVERETIALIDRIEGTGEFAFVWGFEYYKKGNEWLRTSAGASLADEVRALGPTDEIPFDPSTVGEVA